MARVLKDGLAYNCRAEQTSRGVVLRCGACMRGAFRDGAWAGTRCRVCNAFLTGVFPHQTWAEVCLRKEPGA